MNTLGIIKLKTIFIGGLTMHYNTIVIGGGPAGLFAAGKLGRDQKHVLLLERNSVAGRKLLISGAGQCNFTHAGPIEEFFDCYDDKIKFLKKALTTFTNKDTMKFFESSGVAYQVFPNKKVFPKTMKSKDVLDALLLNCQKANVEFKYNETVQNISVYDNIFTIETSSGNRYFSDQVVIATGGKSYAHMGSDGLGYTLAEKLGHTIVSPRPALTDIRTVEKQYKVLSGLSTKDAEITIWREQKKIRSYVGDLLFTHKGLSGPAIINSSRWMYAGDVITVNFLYPQSYEVVKNYFAEQLAHRGKEEVITFLKQFKLPRNLYSVLCETIGLDEHLSCAQVNKKQREQLVQMLTKCPFHIHELGGFHIAMVTTGGVKLKEVNPTTMESRKQKGLYFIGEVLDVDGDTGGYNIQAALSTAYICAKHIIEKVNK